MEAAVTWRSSGYNRGSPDCKASGLHWGTHGSVLGRTWLAGLAPALSPLSPGGAYHRGWCDLLLGLPQNFIVDGHRVQGPAFVGAGHLLPHCCEEALKKQTKKWRPCLAIVHFQNQKGALLIVICLSISKAVPIQEELRSNPRGDISFSVLFLWGPVMS